MTLYFNKKNYSKVAILLSLKAYREFADIDFNEAKNYYRLNFKKIDPDFKDVILDEFSNFTLANTLQNKV